jgi:hypothetical protein
MKSICLFVFAKASSQLFSRKELVEKLQTVKSSLGILGSHWGPVFPESDVRRFAVLGSGRRASFLSAAGQRPDWFREPAKTGKDVSNARQFRGI